MSRASRDPLSAQSPDTPDCRLPGRSTRPATVHGSIALPGCLIHSDISVSALEWICGALRCEDGTNTPPREVFQNFHATIRVQTFDDIDICVKIAATALALGPVATIGLREIVVNAVEHGNLGISFDEKTELLANGSWQAEIERRLGDRKLRDRFATAELRLIGNTYRINVTDQGDGFDWSAYLDPETAPSALLHGRGISLAMGAEFTSVEYRGAGNEVVLRGACAPVANS